MRTLFKIAGLISVLTVCIALGFLKAFSLKARYDNLCIITLGISKLKEKIRLRTGDKTRLFSECFAVSPEKLINLNADDKALLNEFIINFGKSDTKAEIERCDAYISLFKVKTTEAKTEFGEQQRLYKTLGFLGGIFICIFFL